MSVVRVFFIFLLLFLYSASHASAILTDKTEKLSGFNIEYLYDDTSSLSIDDVEKSNFTQTIPSQFTMGYRYGNAWFKLTIKNSSKNENFILYFTEPIWSKLDLYVKSDGEWHIQKNGLDIQLKNRAIKDSLPAYPIHIDQDETIVVYVKGQTIASQVGEFQIFTDKAYYEPNRVSISHWYLIYSFVLFTFVLLNLYNFAMTKEAVYGYYVLYILVFIIFSFMHSGVYINLGFPNWHEGLHVLGQLTLVTLLLFSNEFLLLKQNYPLMNRVFYWLAAGAFIFALLLSQDIPYSTVASNIYFSATLIIIVSVAVILLNRGFLGAKYYLFALVFYLPFMAIMAMNFNTLLPNTDVTRYTFLVGAFIEIFLFTMILANRYKEISHLNEQLIEKQDELQEMKNLLEKKSITDFLTGLYNRRHFVELSQQYYDTAIRYQQELSILLLDIDKFKSINDKYGHHFGDKVLRETANIIKQTLRSSDIVSRYGGEEFIVLLPETTKDKAFELAERIRQKVENNIMKMENEADFRTTVSIGISAVDSNRDKNIDESIKRADMAMYKAKQLGRNTISEL
jgi:diguanylate cyclase (GGDEF)-like protein